MNVAFGHNELTVRLGMLASDAQHALERIAKGEEDAIAGWIAYGAALNEGRTMFPGDAEFGQWLRISNLDKRAGNDIHPGEQQAAMWAAANPGQFEQAKAAGKARTVRGIHAKWQEIDAERKAAEEREKAEKARLEAEARKAAEAEARRKEQEAKAEAARVAEAERKARQAEEDAKRREQAAKAAAERAIAAEAKAKAERELAEARAETERARAKAEAERKAKAKADAEAALADRRAAEQRAAAQKAEKAAETARKTADKAVKKAEKVAAGNTSADHVRGTFGTGENEWYTPDEHMELARRVLGHIDLDPASSEIANQRVKAERFFTIDDDGLIQHWHGRVWMNPPYAQPAIARFAEKLVTEWKAGRIEAAIALTHNYTDTAWFQLMAHSASALCFTRGRVRFVSPIGELAAPTQGQTFHYFGSDVDLFLEVFGKIGLVVRVA